MLGLSNAAPRPHRWIAMNLFEAFEAAMRRSLARLREYDTARIPLPWLPVRAKEIAAIFGEDFWPYGLEPNRRTLEAFLAFAREQGVCQRRLKVEELFAPETRRGTGSDEMVPRKRP